MTWAQGLSLALLAAVVALVAERCRALLFRAALDAGPFRRAVSAELRAGRRESARALVEAASPAWVAEALRPVLDPEIEDEVERALAVEDRRTSLETSAGRRLRALRVAGTVASALGFIGAAIEVRWIFAGDHGLMALEAGRVANQGLSNALISIALGVATSGLALGSWMVLRRAARERLADVDRMVATAEEALDQLASCGPSDRRRPRGAGASGSAPTHSLD